MCYLMWQQYQGCSKYPVSRRRKKHFIHVDVVVVVVIHVVVTFILQCCFLHFGQPCVWITLCIWRQEADLPLCSAPECETARLQQLEEVEEDEEDEEVKVVKEVEEYH